MVSLWHFANVQLTSQRTSPKVSSLLQKIPTLALLPIVSSGSDKLDISSPRCPCKGRFCNAKYEKMSTTRLVIRSFPFLLFSGVKMIEKRRSLELMNLLGLKDTLDGLATASGVRWYVLRRGNGDVLRRALDFEAAGKRGRG